MKRLGLITRMALALTALATALVLLADVFFDVLPDREGQTKAARKTIGESIAVQTAALLDAGDLATIQRTLDGLRSRDATLRSAAVRRADGALVIVSGEHASEWRTERTERSDPRHIVVPLAAGETRWGQLELAFRADARGPLGAWLASPLTVLVIFIGTFGLAAFWLYMRRALQHLDPGSVIPERIRLAFDVMQHGVIVIDQRGRMLLWNKAAERIAGANAGQLVLGRSLSQSDWLAGELDTDATHHPWFDCMARAEAVTDCLIDTTDASGTAKKLVVSCAPVLDARGSARGCLVTVNDVSEIHRANERLRETLVELATSKAEVDRQSHELRRIAMRDPLTGCYNRRAFFELIRRIANAPAAAQQPFSVLLVDIDHFKSVNDRFGHGVGDRVINVVAKVLVKCARSVDLVCRYGGEEFCIALPGVDAQGAMRVAERVRAAIEASGDIALADIEGLSITASVGVASRVGGATEPDPVIDEADAALYAAKRGGRNRVERYGAERDGVEPRAAERAGVSQDETAKTGSG